MRRRRNIVGLDLSDRWRSRDRRSESWYRFTVEALRRPLAQSPWLWRPCQANDSKFLSRGGSSKSRIKLRETVSRCPKEAQQALDRILYFSTMPWRVCKCYTAIREAVARTAKTASLHHAWLGCSRNTARNSSVSPNLDREGSPRCTQIPEQRQGHIYTSIDTGFRRPTLLSSPRPSDHLSNSRSPK